MVGIMALWLPIVVSAVIVFVASSIIHMVLPIHRNDYSKLPDEEKVIEALRQAGVEPGEYAFPHAPTPAEMNTPEMIAKYEKGPVGFMNVIPSGAPAMGGQLVQWFVYTLLVGVFVAYVAGRTLDPGTHYLQVFRVAGTVAILAYAGAEPIRSIWYKRSWGLTLKHLFDGVVYGLLTAGTFGWLWPA